MFVLNKIRHVQSRQDQTVQNVVVVHAVVIVMWQHTDMYNYMWGASRTNTWWKQKSFQEVTKSFQEVTKRHGFPIKFIETSGCSLQNMLERSDPFREEKCGRHDCFPCISGGSGRCDRIGAAYRIVCDEEECRGKEVRYEGESAHSGYTRGRAHLRGYRNKEKENVLWKHACNDHGGRTQRVSAGKKLWIDRQSCRFVLKKDFHCSQKIRKQSKSSNEPICGNLKFVIFKLRAPKLGVTSHKTHASI